MQDLSNVGFFNKQPSVKLDFKPKLHNHHHTKNRRSTIKKNDTLFMASTPKRKKS